MTDPAFPPPNRQYDGDGNELPTRAERDQEAYNQQKVAGRLGGLARGRVELAGAALPKPTYCPRCVKRAEDARVLALRAAAELFSVEEREVASDRAWLDYGVAMVKAIQPSARAAWKHCRVPRKKK
jgi:hypothetical protein